VTDDDVLADTSQPYRRIHRPARQLDPVARVTTALDMLKLST